MQVRLDWQNNHTGKSESYQVASFPCTIGRGSVASLVVDHPTISRQHVELVDMDGALVIENISSGNKLFVNSRECKSTTLQEGDLFQLGEVVFQISSSVVNRPLKQLRVTWKHSETGATESNVFPVPVTIGRHSGAFIKLDEPSISREHTLLQTDAGYVVVTPRSSSGPTLINGEAIGGGIGIRPGLGDVIQVGPYLIMVDVARPVAGDKRGAGKTIIFNPDNDRIEVSPSRPAPKRGNFPPQFFERSVVSYAAVQQSGIPVTEKTYLAIGGGFGSFIWVDNLLVYGVPAADVMSIGFFDKPYERYQVLCRNSQIPDNERLRSNSDSCPDNIWGWPGYAVREIWRLFKQGQIGEALHIAWTISTEPGVLAAVQTYTPRSVDVFNSVDAEMRRIGWSRILQKGSVKAIRKMDDGRYVVAYVDKSSVSKGLPKFAVASYLHLAMGYPGIRVVDDVEEYRVKHNDFKTAVNAYESHDHIYAHLLRSGGTIIIRGSGITASRIIQRVDELRRQNPRINILHLIREPVLEGNQYKNAKRIVENHWEFQPFNWPKAGWGGALRPVLENAPEGEREYLLSSKAWGGTTTADRQDWRAIVNRGLREGWYRLEIATVGKIQKNGNGRLDVQLKAKNIIQHGAVQVDYIVDCTGLISDIAENPVLKDLLDTYRLSRNVLKRLRVHNHFEVEGLDTTRGGRVYASGTITLGGPYAPVDSFLGLQYTAQRSIEHLISIGAPYLKPMNVFRSFAQWVRWAQGVAP